MKFRVHFCLSFLIAGLICTGQEIDEIELRKRLSAISSYNDDLTALKSEELFARAGWILEELRKWKAANPNPPRPVNTEAVEDHSDPFGISSNERPLNDYDFASALGDIFGIVLFKDSSKMVPELQSLARQYKSERAGEYNSLNQTILNYLLLTKLLQMAGRDKPPTIPESKSSLPDYLKGSDPDLVSAWRKGEFVNETLAFCNADSAFSYHEHNHLFEEILEEALVENNWERADQIGNFEWGHFCGAGSGELFWRQYGFMALNRQRQGRKDEAYAILLYHLMAFPETPMLLLNLDSRRWKGLLFDELRKNGFDWETTGCGIALFPRWVPGGAHVLGDFGGNSAALLVAKASRLSGRPESNFDPHLEILNSMLSRNYRGLETGWGDPFGQDAAGKSKPFLTPETEKAVVTSITELALQGEDRHEQSCAIQLLGEHAWPAAKNTIRKLASHPVPSVSRAAFDVFDRQDRLYELKDISPAQIERYELTFTIRGKPLSHLPVSVQHTLLSPNGNGYSGFGGTDVKKLNEIGGLTFDRPDQSHASDLRGFVSVVPSFPEDKMKTVSVTPDTPFFSFIENYEEIKKRDSEFIDIPVIDEFAIHIKLPESKPQSVFIGIQMDTPVHSDGRQSQVYGKNYTMESSEFPVKLTKAGFGRYRFSAWGDGLAVTEIKEPVVVPDSSTITLDLRKGYRLKYVFDSSQSEGSWLGLSRANGDNWENIEQVSYPYQRRNWDHLQEGRYRMKIYHISEEERVIPFTIDASSPSVVDLGRL